jgi:uncharacterized protein (DUF1778 family)
MRSQERNREGRIEAHLAADSLAVVRRAAEIQGLSIEDFIVFAAQEAAEKTIADTEVIRLSREAQERFASLLIDPPPPTDALLHALKRHQELVIE